MCDVGHVPHDNFFRAGALPRLGVDSGRRVVRSSALEFLIENRRISVYGENENRRILEVNNASSRGYAYGASYAPFVGSDCGYVPVPERVCAHQNCHSHLGFGGRLMPLVNAAGVLGLMKTFRVVHVAGRFGGGKTAVAFRLAYELYQQGFVRHIVSNVQSVWGDDPASIVLRDGIAADTAVILDEGGMFLDYGYDAKQWLAYLRKLNIVLIIPSVIPPAHKLKFMQVKRVFNAETVGLPMWVYRVDLTDGVTKEKDFFYWLRPSEIYGIYDTQGFPSDDAGLSEYVKRWTAQAAAHLGYETKKIAVGSSVLVGFDQAEEVPGLGANEGGSAVDAGDSVLEQIRRVASAIEESTSRQAETVSILTEGHKKRGR